MFALGPPEYTCTTSHIISGTLIIIKSFEFLNKIKQRKMYIICANCNENTRRILM